MYSRQLARGHRTPEAVSACPWREKKGYAPCSVRSCGYGTWMRRASEQLQHPISSNDILPTDIGSAYGILMINLLGRENTSRDAVDPLPSPSQCNRGAEFY